MARTLSSEELEIISSWDEVPDFADEREEAQYWSSHQVDVRLMESSVLKSTSSDSVTITLRMDPRMLARLKRLARSRYLNYQSMIKQWMSERLEDEFSRSSQSR